MRLARREALVSIPLAFAVGGALFYAIWIATGELNRTWNLASWVYDGSLVMAGIACLARGLDKGPTRVAFIAFGVGLISWAAGDMYLGNVLYYWDEVPYPSLADAGYLFAIPCFFVGIASMVNQRVGHFPLASWLDGSTVALAAAAVATALLSPALVGLNEGDPAFVLTNLAYPLGDLILVTFLAGALVITGTRGARAITLVCLGLFVWAFADSFYLYLNATSWYPNGWADMLWLIAALLMAASAYPTVALETRRRGVYRSSMIPPALSTLIATGVLVFGNFHPTIPAAVWLAGATIVAAVFRLTLSFRENDRLLSALHTETISDALTGLGNRRSLVADLGHRYENGAGGGASLFAMFDLDGFKSYNDSFGHPAGDALLQRLGDNLMRAADGVGKPYRLGGDEFCILAAVNGADPADVVEKARASLSERGEGFSIGASVGWIIVPEDAPTASEAMRIADQRMYAEKTERSTRSARHTQDLLTRIFREREPALSMHVDEVSRHALALGRKLGLTGEDLETLGRAAQLHDIGKIAIPDDILTKPGPLNEIEWRLIERHTLIGERILGAAPAMRPIATLVRSAHENWDGTGYPDALEADKIPLGARIIRITDAFDAMTSGRPYKKPMTEDEALAELRRCSGTQFEPALVEVFCELVEAGPRVQVPVPPGPAGSRKAAVKQ
ncbi:MAG: bifunctional diguanylate cyclase/phosphohydrolase [Solirubrobacterales bacterium]